MPEVRFNIHISLERYQQLLARQTRSVIVTSHNGRKIQFATGHLRPFVKADGIHGQFRIVFSEKNKFLRMERIN